MKAICALRERLTENTFVIQNEGGYISRVGFCWNEPVFREDVDVFEQANNIILPIQYKDFLGISNGAVLFKDMDYGQWGCDLLALGSLIPATEHARKCGLHIQDDWVVFAKWYGDGDLLLFDMSRYFAGEKDYILDGDQGYQTDEWGYLKGGFDTWLDRLIVAQGSKYWRWY